MNFLAHMFLSCSDEELLIGNFLGDFLKNKHLKSLSDSVKQGIKLHRAIDSFTDQHKEVKKCTALLYPSQGKYAPVVIDILFDYILFQNWKRYTGVEFNEFQNQVYDSLLKYPDEIPDKVKKQIEIMVNGRFLEKYITKEGLEWTFDKVEMRLKFPSAMSQSYIDLVNNYEAFEKSFNLFFPELIAMTDAFCDC